MAGIKVTIDLDESQAIRALKSLEDQLDKTEKTATKKTKSMDQALGSFLGNLAALASVRAFDFLKQQVTEAFAAFQQFEQGLVNVTKTANLTNEETEKLSRNILQLTREIPATTEELLGISTAAGQLGVKGVKSITIFTETIAKLGRVSNLQGEEAATVLARILNVTGESNDQIELLASTIVSLGNNFAATESEIALVTNEVSRATAQFGLSSGEAAAFGAVLRSVGVRAEEASGVFSKSFIAINKAIQSGGASLDKLSKLTGLTGEEIQKTFGESPAKFFRVFLDSLNNVDGGIANAAKTLEGLGISGIRVNKVLPVLAQNTDQINKAFSIFQDEASGATRGLNEEFQRGLESSISQTDLFSNALDRAQVRLGEKFAKAIGVVLPFLTDFVDDIGDADSRIRNFAENTDNIEELTKKVERLTRFNKILTENPLNNFLSGADNDIERNNARLEILNERIRELNKEAGKKTLTSLKNELEGLQQSLKQVEANPETETLFLGLIGGKEGAQKRIKEIQEIIKKGQAETLVGTQATEEKRTEVVKTEAQRRKEFLDELRAVEAQEKMERDEQAALEKDLATEQEFQFLADNLGKEQALRELARIKEIENEDKRQKELLKLRKKAKDEEKAQLFDLRKFEDLTNKQKVQAQRETLQTIASLSSSSNSTLFNIGKAASLALAGINVSEGVTKALAAFSPPFNFAAAAAVGAAGAVQIANIASAKKPSGGSFQEGGIVGGSSFSGDRVQANVNSGEVVFNRRQQENLFNAVNEGNLGSGPSVVINNPVLLEEGSINLIIDQINDALEFNNKTLGAVS